VEYYGYRDRKPDVMHPTKPRIVDIMEFAKGMGCKRVGEAYCGEVGPSILLTEILEINDFKVTAIFCKLGGIEKEKAGL